MYVHKLLNLSKFMSQWFHNFYELNLRGLALNDLGRMWRYDVMTSIYTVTRACASICPCACRTSPVEGDSPNRACVFLCVSNLRMWWLCLRKCSYEVSRCVCWTILRRHSGRNVFVNRPSLVAYPAPRSRCNCGARGGVTDIERFHNI